ncbi:MAG: hypothetical protein BGN87_19765 [Rhizobiales bacterium 65-79]|jgi:hypothetical protein|nr:MAG: hypothetical protein BGN87_19765 [Rhizobiales bacterium 65-79]
MTGMATVAAIVSALDLPSRARVDARVPKKMLVEQGAPTTADKRAIQDGIDEMQWLAVLKPNTIAIPAFTDQTRDYSEIAVIAAAFRPEARAARLTELIHRAIPYPVLLITTGTGGVAISVAPKRAAQNEGEKVVVERVVVAGGIDPDALHAAERAFLDSFALERQPARDLSTVYDGWLARIEALAAARLSGIFEVKDETGVIDRRRRALEEHARLAREATQLRAQAARAKQIGQRVDLNQKIKAIEIAIDRNKKLMLGGSA